MKILKLLATVVVAVSVQNVFADTPHSIPLAKGHFWVGGSAKINLDKLNDEGLYDVVCTIKAVDSSEFPVFLRFTSSGVNFNAIMFDGQPLYTHQQKIADEKSHTVAYSSLHKVPMSSGTVDILTLEGLGTANPVEYDCYANVVIGAKQ